MSALRYLSARVVLAGATLLASVGTFAQNDPLLSWNPGPHKQAIVDFVKAVTVKSSPKPLIQTSAPTAALDCSAAYVFAPTMPSTTSLRDV